MKKIITAVLCAVMTLSLCACGSNTKGSNTESKSSENTAKDLTPVTICLDWAPNTNHTGLYVALEKGYFAEQGLEVSIVQPGDDGATTMVASGKAQFGIDFQDTLASTFTSDTKIPVTAVAALIQHNTSGIISMKEDGIDSFGKMAGHNYATWESPIEQGILKTVITKDGGNFDDVKMIPQYVTDVVSALQADIDSVWIYYGWDGIATEQAGLDTNFLYFKDVDTTFDYYSPVLIANDDFLSKNPDTAKAFLKACEEGYTFAAENPDDAAEILCKQVPELDQTLVKGSQEWLADQYIADAPYWGEIDAERWNGFYAWLSENQLCDEIPENYGFTNEYLPAGQ